MCVDPGTAILIASAVSAGTQYQQGRMQASIARRNNELMKGEIAIRNAALEEERKVAAINAKEEEEVKRLQLKRNLASLKAYNRGKDSASFLALVDYEREALAKDIANIRLGSRIQSSRLATEISVNNVRASTPSMGSYYTKAGALNAIGTMAGGYASYSMVKSPGMKPTSTSTSPSVTSSYTPTSSTSGSYSAVTTPSNSGYTFTG
tara:strand:+ start:2237 stop:2857 length:621 start_codon:yes stop_codon:yes gene_type:complete